MLPELPSFIPSEFQTIFWTITALTILKGVSLSLEALNQVMGYIPPEVPFKSNLDKFGMPRDYATYVWLLYKKIVQDDSPSRRAFLQNPNEVPYFGFGLQYDEA